MMRLIPQICWKNWAAIPRIVRRRFCDGPLVRSSLNLKGPSRLWASSASVMACSSMATSSSSISLPSRRAVT